MTPAEQARYEKALALMGKAPTLPMEVPNTLPPSPSPDLQTTTVVDRPSSPAGPTAEDLRAAASAPYKQRASDLNAQADAAQGQIAAGAPPKPQGFKENLVNSLRAGMEGFAAPGGYFGQEQQRQAAERQRQQDLLNQVKSLRGESAQQQQLGLTEDERYTQEAAQAEKAKQDAATATETARHNRALEVKDVAPLQKASQGEAVLDPTTGKWNIPAPKEAPPKSYQQRTIEDPAHPGQPLDANFDPTSGITTHPATGAVIPNPRSFVKPDKVKEPMDSASLESIINGVKNGDIVRENLRTMVKTEDEPALQAELQKRGIPLLTGQQQTDIRNLDNLSNSIDAVDELSKKVHTSESGIGARVGGILKSGEAAFGYNNDVRQLQSESIRAVSIIRALGERGRIPTQQVQQAQQLLAMNPGLKRSEAELSLSRLRQMIADARAVALGHAGTGTPVPSAGGAQPAAPGAPGKNKTVNWNDLP